MRIEQQNLGQVPLIFQSNDREIFFLDEKNSIEALHEFMLLSQRIERMLCFNTLGFDNFDSPFSSFFAVPLKVNTSWDGGDDFLKITDCFEAIFGPFNQESMRSTGWYTKSEGLEEEGIPSAEDASEEPETESSQQVPEEEPREQFSADAYAVLNKVRGEFAAKPMTNQDGTILKTPVTQGQWDPYAILGLDKSTAQKRDIDLAYRKFSMKLHPDKPGGHEEGFKLLTTAYQAICKELERL
jgi:hypothetical protein